MKGKLLLLFAIVNFNLISQNIVKIPSDSGLIVNGLKEGLWAEYLIDTNRIEFSIALDDKKSLPPVNYLDTTLLKAIGHYLNGFKEGIWFVFENETDSGNWTKSQILNYHHGKKHGIEIHFYSSGDTAMWQFYNNGIKSGPGKQFQDSSQVKLTSIAVNDTVWTESVFGSDGELSEAYKDTLINEIPFRSYKKFYENGALQESGVFTRQGKQHGEWRTYYQYGNLESITTYKYDSLEGLYSYYYQNGQLWVSSIYIKDKLWNVTALFSINGKDLKRGSFKNGTGILFQYDTDGKRTKLRYIDGIEKN